MTTEATGLPVRATMVGSWYAAFATSRTIPGAISICAAFFVLEVVAERSLNINMRQTGQPSADPIVLGLYLWRMVDGWMITLLAVRSIINRRRGAQLWRLDRSAFAVLALTIGEPALYSGISYYTGVDEQDPSLARIGLSLLGAIVGVAATIALMPPLLFLEAALCLDDRVIGLRAVWRRVRGNRMNILLGRLGVDIPSLIWFYFTVIKTPASTGQYLDVIWIANQGLGLSFISLVTGAYGALVYRHLRSAADE